MAVQLSKEDKRRLTIMLEMTEDLTNNKGNDIDFINDFPAYLVAMDNKDLADKIHGLCEEEDVNLIDMFAYYSYDQPRNEQELREFYKEEKETGFHYYLKSELTEGVRNLNKIFRNAIKDYL